jgi:hypothetical protein
MTRFLANPTADHEPEFGDPWDPKPEGQLLVIIIPLQDGLKVNVTVIPENVFRETGP